MKKIIMVVFVLTVLSVMGMGKNASAATVVPTALPSNSFDMTQEPWKPDSTWITSGSYMYQIIDAVKKEICIRRINSTDCIIVIPDQIDGYTVRCIGYYGASPYGYWLGVGDLSLGDCASTLQEVVIPDTVRQIGMEAFRNFKQLTKITLPSELVFIENDAFQGCTLLDNVALPDGVVLRDGIFLGCSSLKHVTSKSVRVSSGDDDSGMFDSMVDTWFVKASGEKFILLNDMSFREQSGIKRLYCDSEMEGVVLTDEVGGFIKKLFIQGQDTAFKINTDQKSIATALYTVHGAKCIKTAKKYRMTYHVKKVEKAKKLKRAKKQGKYQYRWGKSKTTITTHRYQKSSKKWKAKTKEEKTVYLIYERKTKSGAYQLVKTTTKRSYTSKVKRVKVKCQKTWK